MIYGSVCSGIEAATVAWHQLGWKPSFFSEIDKFPRSVLSHHYPDVPLHGDFTTIKENQYEPINLLVGGTPCQSFSVAGLRKGLADERGNLTLEFIRLAKRTKPQWILWENVPGVLSQDSGRAFASFLGGLAECGYGFAYRVLDAQYFGVPQRRRRVFVVGYLGDWRPAAAVLFERESLRGDITPSRSKGKDVAAFTSSSIGGYSEGIGTLRANGGDTSYCLNAGGMARLNSEDETLICIQGNLIGRDINSGPQGQGYDETGTCYTLTKTDVHAVVQTIIGGIDYENNAHGPDDVTGPLLKGSPTGGGRPLPAIVQSNTKVRRLTPLECERLQGFPDNYTLIPKATDGARYKALGNSMAVPVMKWLGERIFFINNIRIP